MDDVTGEDPLSSTTSSSSTRSNANADLSGKLVLHARGVSRRFGEVIALSTTDLEVERGQRVVFIGPSGCGKSTLLRILIGLLTTDTGEVRFDGEKVTPENAERLRRQRMGYVIQSGGLFPHLTARENTLLLPKFLEMPEAELGPRVDELCELARLPKSALDRYPGELSGGQRQRVALMRAMFTNPDVLFLDEPLGAVDPMTRNELQAELVDIFDALKTTVVMVTHDLAEAAYFGHKIVLMKDGHIVQAGSIETLASSPADPFVQEFLRAHRPFVPDALMAVDA